MSPVNTTIIGLIIPFSGTALGAAMVFFLKNSMSEKLEKSLMGFAAGVMAITVETAMSWRVWPLRPGSV